MRGLASGVVAALWAFACQAPAASAQTVTITASGVANGGEDGTGVFFAPGSPFYNTPFSFTATFNIAKAGHDNFGNRSDVYGGAGYSYLPYDPPSLGGGSLTINGVTEAIEGDWNTVVTYGSNGTYSSTFEEVQDYTNTSAFYQNSDVVLVESPGFGLFNYPNLGFPSGNLCLLGQCAEGNFEFYESVNGVVTQQAVSNLYPTNITITETSAVPEPMTWALMIGGMFGLGAAVRAARFGRLARA